MQVAQENNFLYEERNENFPESTFAQPSKASGIGKIIARYRSKQPEQLYQGSKKQVHHHHHVSTVSGLNYSQIYNELKINKINSNGSGIDSQLQPNNDAVRKGEDSQQNISRTPYNFQSAMEIRNQGIANRKVLPGIILHTPKNTDTSYYSNDQQAQQISKRTKGNRHFRISEIRDKYEKKANIHQFSALNINQNSSQFEPEELNRSVGPKTDRTNMDGKIHGQTDNKLVEKVEQRPLANSRSIGVGNHRIDKKDLEGTHEQSGRNSPVVLSRKNTPRYVKEQDSDEQNKRQIRQSKSKGLNDSSNPEKVENAQTKSIEEIVQVKKIKRDKVYSFQQMENVHIQRKFDNQDKKITNLDVNESKGMKQKIELKEESKVLEKINDKSHQIRDIQTPKSTIKIKEKLEEIQIHASKSKQVEVQTEKVEEKQKEKHEPISIEVSRVASTIKPKANHAENNEQHEQLLENENDIELNLHFEPIADEQGQNILAQLKQSQPKEEKPHPNQPLLEKQDYIARFNVQEYSKVYNILKSIQISLKSSIMNVQEILRCIKHYLQIIAIGNLDNIDEFDLPLHKKKIIKNSLFLERVAMIVLAFTYTTHTIKQNLKYILNMVTYSINNCLVLIKVLEETQIAGKDLNKKIHEDSAFVKSDRLAMKRNLDSLRNNNNVLMDVIQKLSKGQELFYENLNHIVKLISKSSLEQTFYSLLEYFSFFLCVSQLDHMIPFLAVAPNPYLSPMVTSKYTLVIDVVQIFCYGTKKSKTNIFRPYTQHFLTEMSQYYEIVSFSPMFPTQIDKIIDMLDPKGHISHRLYKHHTINSNNQSLKSLDRIGRNLDEMVLLDNENGGGSQSLENCIHVPVWKGNKNDTILAQLCPLLAMIALKKIPAQEAVGKVREQNLKNKKQGVKYISFGISLD